MQTSDDLDIWEHRMETAVGRDRSITETEREGIIRARRSQGLSTDWVMVIETRCRITGVTNPIHLVASHCKPWRDSKMKSGSTAQTGFF
jgi:hypothetical protein